MGTRVLSRLRQRERRPGARPLRSRVRKHVFPNRSHWGTCTCPHLSVCTPSEMKGRTEGAGLNAAPVILSAHRASWPLGTGVAEIEPDSKGRRKLLWCEINFVAPVVCPVRVCVHCRVEVLRVAGLFPQRGFETWQYLLRAEPTRYGHLSVLRLSSRNCTFPGRRVSHQTRSQLPPPR